MMANNILHLPSRRHGHSSLPLSGAADDDLTMI
jgi:hypothetical protein